MPNNKTAAAEPSDTSPYARGLSEVQRTRTSCPFELDTHVHNAFINRINYSFPKAFPDLATRNWSIPDFVQATGNRSVRTHVHTAHKCMHACMQVSAILMELDKDGEVFEQSLLEAELYHQTMQRYPSVVKAIVASAPVSLGASTMRRFLPQLLSRAPSVRGVREAWWKTVRLAYRAGTRACTLCPRV